MCVFVYISMCVASFLVICLYKYSCSMYMCCKDMYSYGRVYEIVCVHDSEREGQIGCE